mgnify:CR=1 FL=1
MYLRQDFRMTRKNRRQRQFREVASAQTYGTFLRRLLRLRPADRLAPQKSQIQSRPPEPYSFPQLTTLTFLLEIGCYTIHGSSFRTFRDFRGWIINSRDVANEPRNTRKTRKGFSRLGGISGGIYLSLLSSVAHAKMKVNSHSQQVDPI